METKIIDGQVYVLESDALAEIQKLKTKIPETPNTVYLLTSSLGPPRRQLDQCLYAYPNYRAAVRANETDWGGELKILEIDCDFRAM